MTKISILLSPLLLFSLGIFSFIIAADDLDNITMEIATTESKRGHRIQMHSKEIVLAFMLKNGDITEEEIKAFKTKRQKDREELTALKASGDTEAFQTCMKELKAERDTQRKEFKDYIDNNDELKQNLREQRYHSKERFRDKRRNGDK